MLHIYRQNAGSDTAVLVDTVTAVAKNGIASFASVVPNLRKNATVIARTGQVTGSLPGSDSVNIKVNARVSLCGSSKLLVQVRPSDVTGKARLQRRLGSKWRAFKTATVKNGVGTVRLSRGTYTLRAKFPATKVCAAGTSRTYRVTVK